jgi:hypothetical protein
MDDLYESLTEICQLHVVLLKKKKKMDFSLSLLGKMFAVHLYNSEFSSAKDDLCQHSIISEKEAENVKESNSVTDILKDRPRTTVNATELFSSCELEMCTKRGYIFSTTFKGGGGANTHA